jgi:hypothetical protein
MQSVGAGFWCVDECGSVCGGLVVSTSYACQHDGTLARAIPTTTNILSHLITSVAVLSTKYRHEPRHTQGKFSWSVRLKVGVLKAKITMPTDASCHMITMP